MQESEQGFSFRSLLFPLTTLKAINVIIVVGIIVFGNMLFNGFVWDDKTYIIFNPQVYVLDVIKLTQQNMFNQAGNYRPISALYFASLFAFFKDTPFFYHFFQLTLHIINSSLIYVLFKRFVNRGLALFLALIFLVHPIQVESVSYIASISGILFFLFGVTALILVLKDAINTRRILIICGLLLLSFLSKETGFLFLFIIFIYLIIFKKGKIALFSVGGIIISCTYFFIRFVIGKVYFSNLEIIPMNKLSLMERLANIPSIIYYYLKTSFFPKYLSIDQLWTVTKVNFQNFYFPLCILLLLMILLYIGKVYFCKRSKEHLQIYLFFLIWLFSGLIMHVQLFPLDLTVADRWFYFPIVGLLGIIGIILQSTKSFYRHFKMSLCVFGVIIVICLSVRTMIRNVDWHDALTLYTHDSKMQTNYDIENMLGVEYATQQKYDEALMHYEKSRELYAFPVNTYNIGYIYEQKGEYQKAGKYYVKAIEESPGFALKNNQLTILHERLVRVKLFSDSPGALNNFIKEELLKYPTSGVLWMYKAINEYKLYNQKEALVAADKARKLLPIIQTKNIYERIQSKQPIEMVP